METTKEKLIRLAKEGAGLPEPTKEEWWKSVVRYWLSPSEIECRVAMARIQMTPSQRLAHPPVQALLEEEKASRAFIAELRTWNGI